MLHIKRINTLGERAILLDFEEDFSELGLQILIAHIRALENLKLEQKVEVTNTYNSLLISYPTTIKDVYNEFSLIKAALENVKLSNSKFSRCFTIPVCYEEDFAPDLEEVATLNNLTKQEVINIHCQPKYLIYFLGFLPGFLYMGGMDNKIATPRKLSPRNLVHSGSVGIAEDQTGIYPSSSPGGWQIIGRSPIKLFDLHSGKPSPFEAGDLVQFREISKMDYFQIKEQVKRGEYRYESDVKNG